MFIAKETFSIFKMLTTDKNIFNLNILTTEQTKFDFNMFTTEKKLNLILTC